MIPALKRLEFSLWSILTGDSSAQVEQSRHKLGITDLTKSLWAVVRNKKWPRSANAVAQGDIVLMVGDGINDSPSFHAAHVSVALDQRY